MKEIIVQLITAFFGSLGFALLFNMRKKHLLAASAVGMLGWGMYLLMESFGFECFVVTFLASSFTSLCCELCGELLDAPATMFFITAVVPLIPGRSLYYTVYYMAHRDLEQAKLFAGTTAQYAIGIACGISAVWTLFRMLRTALAGRTRS